MFTELIRQMDGFTVALATFAALAAMGVGFLKLASRRRTRRLERLMSEVETPAG